MNLSRIITVVIGILIAQSMLLYFIFSYKRNKTTIKEGRSGFYTRSGMFELEPINLGEIIVSLPTIKEEEEITARVKIVIYVGKSSEAERKEIESKYLPKLRQIAAKIIKGSSYTKLRNLVEEEEAVKILMKNMMNKEIGKEIVQEVVFDGAIIFE